jgi:hypothetical protein
VSSAGGSKWRLLHIPVLAVPTMPPALLTQQLRVLSLAADLVEPRTYVVDRDTPARHQLLFVNGLGGYDCLPLRSVEVDQDVKHDTVERQAQASDTLTTPQFAVATTSEEFKLRLLTHYLTRGEWHWLQHLGRARYQWLRTPTALLPVAKPRQQLRFNPDEPQAKGLTLELQVPDRYRLNLLLPQ